MLKRRQLTGCNCEYDDGTWRGDVGCRCEPRPGSMMARWCLRFLTGRYGIWAKGLRATLTTFRLQLGRWRRVERVLTGLNPQGACFMERGRVHECCQVKLRFAYGASATTSEPLAVRGCTARISFAGVHVGQGRPARDGAADKSKRTFDYRWRREWQAGMHGTVGAGGGVRSARWELAAACRSWQPWTVRHGPVVRE